MRSALKPSRGDGFAKVAEVHGSGMCQIAVVVGLPGLEPGTS